jgi:hypothetical protein
MAPTEYTDEYNKIEKEELSKCKNDIIYFAEGWLINFPLYEKQKEILNEWNAHKKHLTLSTRQTGMTTLYCIYAIHQSIFNPFRNTFIACPRMAQTEYIIDSISEMMDRLPSYFFKILNKNKNRIKLDNNSTITTDSFSNEMCRGLKIDNMLVDNIDHAYRGFSNSDILRVTIPAFTGSQDSKLFMSGTPTPKGVMVKLFDSGQFHTNKILWSDIPNRDNTWANEMKQLLGEDVFSSEFELPR